MSDTLFSVIIPTRQRHDTLRYAIQTVLNQTYPNFELIVMDNCSSPETEEVTRSFSDPRIKYYRATERLSMSDNWELGLSYATGDYIFMLGDDDGIMPDGLEIGLKFIKEYNVKIVSWEKYSSYCWSSCIVPWYRDRLFIHNLQLQKLAVIYNSNLRLKQFYGWKIGYACMPMIYNSFIHKDIIFKVKSVYGKYFMSSIPDVYSGIVNAYFSDQYIYSIRPLALAGISGHSTGVSQSFLGLDSKPIEDFIKDEKKNIFNEMHHLLLPSNNPELLMADVQLKTKDLFFKDDKNIKLTFVNLLNWMARGLSRDPSTYETFLQDIKTLANKHKIPLVLINFAEKSEQYPEQYQGFNYGANGSVTGLTINCQQAEITNISQAVMLAQGMLPKSDSLTVYKDKSTEMRDELAQFWYTLRSIISARSRLNKVMKLALGK